MKPIAVILVAVATVPASAYTPLPIALQWRMDAPSGSDRYIWPEVCDEFIRDATLEEIRIRFLSQSMYGGAQRLEAWLASGQAGNRFVPMTASMQGVLTDGQVQLLVDRMTEEARGDPWAVSNLIGLMRFIGPTPSEIPFSDEDLTFTLYEGLIDLPGTKIYEFYETPMIELISHTPRTDLWIYRIQADIELEEQTNGDSDRLQFLRQLKKALGGRPWLEQWVCD